LNLVWLVFYYLADERRNKRVRATAKKEASMKISQAAAASGLTVKTVRYYANIGLVSPTIDTATG
jgi:hypothetical protein